MPRPHRLPGSRILFALAAGLAAGACGGTLYDADGVPKLDPGGQVCDLPTQHACGLVCKNNDDPDACLVGASCVVCPDSPANGQRVCAPVGAGGAFACEFECLPGFFKTATGCEAPVAVAAGERHACAVTSGGAVACWGSNEAGQLGAAPDAGGPTPMVALATGAAALPARSTAPTVAPGGLHTCAITAAQGVRCWGSNASGQLGAPGGPGPVTVALAGAGTTATAIASGTSHTCVVVSGGAVQCWGANGSGQLGTGDTAPHATPVASLVTSGATAVAAFRETTCALVGGTVRCWGANGDGQLGQGTSTAFGAIPLEVPLPAAPELVSVGGHHACATTAGGLYCWGSHAELQLGTRAAVSVPSGPVQAERIDNGQDGVAVATGDAHTCSARPAATVEFDFSCAGRNDQGQPGQAAANPTDEGTAILTSHAVAASAGLDHTCALVESGAGSFQAWCWGANGAGQIGRPTAVAFSPLPGVVPP